MTVDTQHLEGLLAKKYETGKYVRIWEAPQANSGGGRCDLIAVGVWRSTGNQIIGHEIKSSRADWMKELQSPEKSEVFSQHCHRWYIVATHGIVKLEELQPHWGLMEATKNGGSLKIRRQAQRNESPKQISINMMAAWLRRVSERANEAELSRARRAGYDQGFARGKASVDHTSLARAERESASYKEAINEFEKVSGIRIHQWNAGQLGDAVRSLTNAGLASQTNRLAALAENAERIAADARECVKSLEEELT